MPPGPDRTYRMTLVLTRARNLGRQAVVDRQRLAGYDGQRIVAIAVMQGRPELADATALTGIVRDSRSAFEQYAALEALQGAVSRLSPEQRRTVGEAMRAELSKPDTRLQPGTDRYRLAQRLLSALA